MLTSGLPEQECARLDLSWSGRKRLRDPGKLLLYPGVHQARLTRGEGLQNRNGPREGLGQPRLSHTDASHLPSDGPSWDPGYTQLKAEPLGLGPEAPATSGKRWVGRVSYGLKLPLPRGSAWEHLAMCSIQKSGMGTIEGGK